MRLHRPHIPLSTRVIVAERQLIERHIWNHENRTTMDGMGFTPKARLAAALDLLFHGATCHLDHDPALGARYFDIALGQYRPDANDPDYLVYRLKEDHRTKTFVRGEHGQYADIALIKRERRRKKKEAAPDQKKKHPWPTLIMGTRHKIASRPFQKTQRPMRGK